MASRYVTVFISSTAKDLTPHRRAVIDAMMKLDGVHPDAMEYFGARDAVAVSFCKKRICDADVYVGLIGNFRGWEPDGDPGTRSITEMEHDWAAEQEKPRLVFIAPDGFAPPGGLPAMTAEASARQQAFRMKVSSLVAAFDFSSPDALARDVLAAVANYRIRKILEEMQRPAAADASIAAAAPGKVRGPSPSGLIAADPGAAIAVAEALADPDFAAQAQNPATFDVRRLESAIAARAEQRSRTASGEAKSTADDYKRLGAIARLYDVGKARLAYEKAVAADPADIGAWINLGETSLVLGSAADARCAFAEAIRRAEAARDLRLLMTGTSRMADALLAAGDARKASRLYGASLAIADRLAPQDPANLDRVRELAVAYNKMGDAALADSKEDEALAAFSKAMAISEKLNRTDPGHSEWQRDLSTSCDRIGNIVAGQGKLDEALDHFRRGLDISEQLASADPASAILQRDLSVTLKRIGDVLAARGQAVAALDMFERSLEISARLAASDPGNAGWQADLAASHGKVGEVQASLCNRAEAMTRFEARRAILAPLVKDADRWRWKDDCDSVDCGTSDLKT